MQPAGARAFELRTDDKTGIYAFEREEPAMLSPEQERVFRANAKAWAFFEAQAPWYRRTATHRIVSAKKEETRERRLAQLIEDSASGRTIGPLTRPDRKG